MLPRELSGRRKNIERRAVSLKMRTFAVMFIFSSHMLFGAASISIIFFASCSAPTAPGMKTPAESNLTSIKQTISFIKRIRLICKARLHLVKNKYCTFFLTLCSLTASSCFDCLAREATTYIRPFHANKTKRVPTI